ncbi:MAG: chromosome partitioning protein ParB [Alphaproteobacteria bacterium]|nr:chromosome partitioning protein ParB [Alphaproteobacteria bacterium]
MRDIAVRIEEIYIPRAHQRPIDAAKVQALAESIIETGLRSPILVRRDKDRYVLVSGLHRLEACKALGEKTVTVNIVQARKF